VGLDACVATARCTATRGNRNGRNFREKKTKENFQAGLQCLSFFLQESEPNRDLVEYLEKNQLDPVQAKELPRISWAEDKTKVEQEVEVYLKANFWLRSGFRTF